MGKLQNQVAIVTGAGRGIGKAIAQSLAAEGATVVLAARTASEIELLAHEIISQGANAVAVVADVTNEVDVHNLVKETVKSLGRVDILVNNAGIGVFKKVMEMEVEEFDRMWNVNMRGVFLATKAVLPHMTQAKMGHIVNISSLAGKNTFVGGAGYAATKWALRGFAGSLMLEVRDLNIRVTTIFPGSVDTTFSSVNLRGNKIPQPSDIADAVLFVVTAPGRTMVSEIDVRPTNPK
ncbi:MAG: SDR family oxidoreductase [Bacteroidota bacterium]